MLGCVPRVRCHHPGPSRRPDPSEPNNHNRGNTTGAVRPIFPIACCVAVLFASVEPQQFVPKCHGSSKTTDSLPSPLVCRFSPPVIYTTRSYLTCTLLSISSRNNPPPASSFQCKWEGCRYPGSFNRLNDLMHHVKNIHASPRTYTCPVENCSEVSNRKDNLLEHKRRRHQQG